MLHFNVDDAQATSGCVQCCCESLQLKPGTINRVSVGYAIWAVPIGHLHCCPQFQIEAMETCPTPVTGNTPPQVMGRIAFDVATDGHLDGDLRIGIVDAEGATLTFKALVLYGPKHGKLVLDKTGMFDYDPVPLYQGPDNFFCSASDGVNAPVVFEVLIGVGIPSASVLATPSISIDPNAVTVDSKYYTVSFPIKISPAAQLCEVWRLTVLQGALDCECNCYQRTDCFDIKVVKC